MTRAPILYLDLDDTIIAWEDGVPHAAPGAAAFVRWALEHMEVRWLTTWCPSGEMGAKLLHDLAHLLQLPVQLLSEIRGGDWSSTESKLNGVLWLEHLVYGRPFVWLEDEYGFQEREMRVLREMGLHENYIHCNVSRDRDALHRAQARLMGWLESGSASAA